MKLATRFLLFIALCVISNYATADNSRYRYLKLPAATITAALNNSSFTHFVFSFKTLISGDLILSVGAYNNDNIIGTTSNLATYSHTPNFRNLPNDQPGIFILTRQIMDSIYMDGTEDIYFKPMKYREGTSGQKNFVSYKIEDFANKKIRGKIYRVTPFEMNPSPPAFN